MRNFEKKIFSVISLDKDIGGISKMIEISTSVLSNNSNLINLFLINKSQTEKALVSSLKMKNININKLSFIEKNLLKIGYLKKKYKKNILESDIIFIHNYKLLKYLKNYLDLKPFIFFFHTDKEKQIYGLEKIKKVFTVNNFTMNLINNKYKEKKAHYLPNCIDTKNKKYSFKKNNKKKLIVGAMGRLVEKKGFENLISVFKRIQNLELQIAGDGPLMNHLAKKARGYNNIKLLGWIKNKNQFFKKIDIFFCSSSIEPFGLVILEAMLYSVPVISTNCKGPIDIINHMKNGILVKIDDKPAMEKAIILLERNAFLREKISKNAYDVLKNNYSIEVYKKNIFSEIKEYL